MKVDALKAAVGVLPDLIFSLDPDGRYTGFAGGGAPYVPTEQFLGRRMDEVLPPEVAVRSQAAFEACMESREVQELRYELGDRRFVCRLAPAPTGVVAIARDVTERTDLEAQLNRAMRLEAVGRLAGSVAHDLNNTLTCILAVSAAALRETDDAQQVEDLELIQDAARSAAQVMARMLAFSRQKPGEPRSLVVDDALGDIQRLLARMLGEEHRLQLDLAGDGAAVRIDPGALEQIIVNLVINARDATPGGGVIELRTRALPDGLVIEVADTGLGMDSATLARCVEPFFTTKAEGRGTGLGLSSCHQLAQQAGGDFAIRSALGLGTTVTLTLPRGEVSLDLPRQPRELRPRRVLVVDDNAMVRDSVERMLVRLGFEVHLCASVGEAELLLDRSEVDCALVDIVMPGRPGLELVEALHAAGVRVVLMSGYSAHEAVVDLGADDQFLQKPFDLQDLAEVLGD